ncbi:transfer complex protein [Halorubrum californiense DSM 19288]|uniref:Transfer complex protein n=1 Tax=Halorubrum californiense DSM 19288 TaxID=1227465 RepID=M0E3X9_9EURY|nr:VirB4 family type IV secretion system protein [Halorubrum californiense]ELZ41652.1 transfer complex protein [Halorubrum californiense DSM 19288]
MRELVAVLSGVESVAPSTLVIGVTVGGGTLVIGLLVGVWLQARRPQRDPEVDLSAFIEPPTDPPAPDPDVRAPQERHQDAVAPAAVAWESRCARVGDEWTTTLYIADWPDQPSDGYLSELFTLTDVRFHLTAHVTPRDQERALDQLQTAADDLKVDADLESSVRSTYLHDRADEAAATYRAVEAGTRVFSQGVFVTVRADDREELRTATRRVKRVLREQPAKLAPKTAICAQERALRSAAPFGTAPLDRQTIGLSGAVGALLASPHRPTLLESDGVELGVHRHTDTPVVVDPFARENGYATFTVGDPGSGKSFSAKQRFIRSVAHHEDRIGVILEPLNDWAGVAEALDAQWITVGGTLGINPLEITPPTEQAREQVGADASPLTEKQERVSSFLANFFAQRGVSLGDRRTTLELAIETAYRNAGITEDVTTHDRASPTLRDVIDVLEELVADPDAFTLRTDAEAAKLEADATWLIDQLRPFAPDGQFAHLGRQSEVDFAAEDLIYLDLAQQEGRVGGRTTLVMQLLISLVYERAKQTDKEVVFVIDEARYVLRDAANLAFLETIFRHHRHHDLSIQLVTQTVDEFFERAEAEMILDQCAIKQFHRLDGMDDHWAAEFGLNDAQKRFVQEAVPGNEELGYAEALVGVDGEWRGIEVRAVDAEKHVIEGAAYSEQ